MNKPTYKSGEKVPDSGQYEIVEPIIKTGHMIVDDIVKGTGDERTLVKGEPFPPTPKKEQEYIEVDPTKHKAAKK